MVVVNISGDEHVRFYFEIHEVNVEDLLPIY